jgi:thymidylate synthase (FAD)
MNVNLINITPDAEEHIVEVARVSSSRNNKRDDYEGLIRYLIKHKHWSPFEHAYATFEIETSKAIGIQLIRHRSFTFQEFSQRYQFVQRISNDMFESVELRQQAKDNRQSSTELFTKSIHTCGGKIDANEIVEEALRVTEAAYVELINAGVARECARMVLPLCTKTKIHMTGSIRSWIHFIQLRDDEHAQKEIRDIAKLIRKEMANHLPHTFKTIHNESNDISGRISEGHPSPYPSWTSTQTDSAGQFSNHD